MLTNIFIIIILLLILLSVFTKQTGREKLFYIAKPLTMLFIIALPLLEVREEYSTYAFLIMTGLIFSLLGDLFLLNPDRYFNNGLYSFLLAHILYILAFNQNVDSYCGAIALPILIYMVIVLRYLSPRLGGMKYPVIIYMVVISTMVYSAWNNSMNFSSGINILLIGAILFAISDTVLAFNKFYKKFKLAEPIILSTYFIAQLFFAMSI